MATEPRAQRSKGRQAGLHVKVHTFDSFRYRDYRLLWTVTVFAAGGYWLQQVIVGWLTYDLTRSAFWTSIAMGLDALPVLLAGPLGGLIVDAWDRRKLLLFIFTYQVLIILGFSVIVLTGVVATWHILGFIFLMGLSWVITDPARIALIPNIVPRQSMVNAFALNSMAFSITRLAAPAAGGVLIAMVGPGPTLLAQAALPVVAFFVAWAIRTPSPSRARLRLASAFSRLAEGARYVRGQQVILGMLLLTALPSALVMPFVHGLMPVYAAEVFRVDSRGLGLLLASLGFGATLGTVLLASLGDFGNKGRLVVMGLALTAILMALFSHNPWLGTSYLNLAALSMGVMMFFTTSSAVVQSMVSDELRGRVTGLNMMTWGIAPAGSILAGALAQRFGAPMATLIGSGIMALALTGLVLHFRAVWKAR